jgi:hypothetical protein
MSMPNDPCSPNFRVLPSRFTTDRWTDRPNCEPTHSKIDPPVVRFIAVHTTNKQDSIERACQMIHARPIPAFFPLDLRQIDGPTDRIANQPKSKISSSVIRFIAIHSTNKQDSIERACQMIHAHPISAFFPLDLRQTDGPTDRTANQPKSKIGSSVIRFITVHTTSFLSERTT